MTLMEMAVASSGLKMDRSPNGDLHLSLSVLSDDNEGYYGSMVFVFNRRTAELMRDALAEAYPREPEVDEEMTPPWEEEV